MCSFEVECCQYTVNYQAYINFSAEISKTYCTMMYEIVCFNVLDDVLFINIADVTLL